MTQIPSEVYRAGYLDAARAPLQPSADEIKAYAEGMCLPRTCVSPFVALGQPITNCKPTAVSSVALAACKETAHVWSPTTPSCATPPQA